MVVLVSFGGTSLLRSSRRVSCCYYPIKKQCEHSRVLRKLSHQYNAKRTHHVAYANRGLSPILETGGAFHLTKNSGLKFWNIRTNSKGVPKFPKRFAGKCLFHSIPHPKFPECLVEWKVPRISPSTGLDINGLICQKRTYLECILAHQSHRGSRHQNHKPTVLEYSDCLRK